jgi:methylated-DNA-[protein]-cysteine S-methyltransferase
MVYSTRCPSPLGALTLAADADGYLVGLWLEGQKHFGGALAEELRATGSASSGASGGGSAGRPLPPAVTKIFADTERWLRAYFRGEHPNPADLPLAPAGATPFRETVWRALLEIPYGATTTYAAIAKGLAATGGAGGNAAGGSGRLKNGVALSRTVGGAVGHNPISIIIPCHRVVGANGHLTGYAGGLAAKQKLLALEAPASALPRPTVG